MRRCHRLYFLIFLILFLEISEVLHQNEVCLLFSFVNLLRMMWWECETKKSVSCHFVRDETVLWQWHWKNRSDGKRHLLTNPHTSRWNRSPMCVVEYVLKFFSHSHLFYSWYVWLKFSLLLLLLLICFRQMILSTFVFIGFLLTGVLIVFTHTYLYALALIDAIIM